MAVRWRILSFAAMFSTLMICYVYRTTLSPTVLVMFYEPSTQNNDPTKSGSTASTDSSGGEPKECPYVKNSSNQNKFTPRIPMSSSRQNTLLSAYFYGYMITNFIGALMVVSIGPRYTMMIGIGGATVFNFLTVPASYIKGWEFAAIFACRFMIGMFCGPLYSSIHELIARWAPTPELTISSVITHSGNIVGLIVAFGLGYFVETSPKAWEYYLYFCGALGIVGFILWFLFVYDQPWVHPYISEKEKNYIISCNHPDGIKKKETLRDIPIKDMFTCRYLYIISIAHLSNNFILYAFLTNHAKFLKKYYHVSASQASVYSIIPFAFNTLCQLFAGWLISKLQKKIQRPATFFRRLAGVVGFVIAPLFLIPVGFFGCDGIVLAEIFLTLSMGGIAFNQPGFFTQIIEISPAHASLTMGFSNMVASIPGFVTSELLTGLIDTLKLGIIKGYAYYFVITAAITMTGGFIWLCFCSSENQKWGKRQISINNAPQQVFDNSEEKIISH